MENVAGVAACETSPKPSAARALPTRSDGSGAPLARAQRLAMVREGWAGKEHAGCTHSLRMNEGERACEATRARAHVHGVHVSTRGVRGQCNVRPRCTDNLHARAHT